MSEPDKTLIEMERMQLVKAAESLNISFVDAGDWRAMYEVRKRTGEIEDHTLEVRKGIALAKFRITGSLTEAANSAGVSVHAIDDWKRRDPAFADMWKESVQGISEDNLRLLRNEFNHQDGKIRVAALRAASDLMEKQRRNQILADRAQTSPDGATFVIMAPQPARLPSQVPHEVAFVEVDDDPE